MALLSSATVLRLVDSMVILLSQAYQLARARLASATSPIVRLLVQRDQMFTEVDLPPGRWRSYGPSRRRGPATLSAHALRMKPKG